MKFKEGNKIVYGQDFRCFQGIPHDIDFDLEIEGNLMWLKGPGYGVSGDYGNGVICIHLPNGESLLDECKESLGDIAFKAIKQHAKTEMLKIIDEI